MQETKEVTVLRSKRKNLRIRTLWSEGSRGKRRIGVVIGGQDGKLVQLRVSDAEVLEFSERYFLRRFSYVGPATDAR